MPKYFYLSIYLFLYFSVLVIPQTVLELGVARCLTWVLEIPLRFSGGAMWAQQLSHPSSPLLPVLLLGFMTDSFVCLFGWFFRTGFLCVALDVLEIYLSVDQAGQTQEPASAFRVLGLKACVTTRLRAVGRGTTTPYP